MCGYVEGTMDDALVHIYRLSLTVACSPDRKLSRDRALACVLGETRQDDQRVYSLDRVGDGVLVPGRLRGRRRRRRRRTDGGRRGGRRGSGWRRRRHRRRRRLGRRRRGRWGRVPGGEGTEELRRLAGGVRVRVGLVRPAVRRVEREGVGAAPARTQVVDERRARTHRERRLDAERDDKPAGEADDNKGDDPADDGLTEDPLVHALAALEKRDAGRGADLAVRRGEGQAQEGANDDDDGGAELDGVATRRRDDGELHADGADDLVSVEKEAEADEDAAQGEDPEAVVLVVLGRLLADDAVRVVDGPDGHEGRHGVRDVVGAVSVGVADRGEDLDVLEVVLRHWVKLLGVRVNSLDRLRLLDRGVGVGVERGHSSLLGPRPRLAPDRCRLLGLLALALGRRGGRRRRSGRHGAARLHAVGSRRLLALVLGLDLTLEPLGDREHENAHTEANTGGQAERDERVDLRLPALVAAHEECVHTRAAGVLGAGVVLGANLLGDAL
mmetsp:Transcript_12914/g.22066  ORF Transcript_12914/g.22066 Transcript_12914/m.22066 type:complete len:499 (+) Transcript_12914:158-1654(+)